MLVLFLLYLGMLALYWTAEDPGRGSRAAAILALVGSARTRLRLSLQDLGPPVGGADLEFWPQGYLAALVAEARDRYAALDAEVGDPERRRIAANVIRSGTLERMAALLDPKQGMRSREIEGGTGPAAVAAALAEANQRLNRMMTL